MAGREPGSPGGFEGGFHKVETRGSSALLVHLESPSSPGKI
jgi:hypothetical protein